MSVWTHVAAIFRIDSLYREEGKFFQDILGKELSYYDNREKWEEASKHPDRYLPSGSEGSLNMSVWEDPNPSSIAVYTVSVFGDLCDHENPNEIFEWFDRICKRFMIRQAVITVDNTLKGTKTKTYDYEEGR